VEEGTAARRLYSSRSFYQRLRLPDNVSAAGIKASTKEGVLTVLLPKAPKAESKRKEIPVA
jgi:HSP20 family molecular chaperone IbpA